MKKSISPVFYIIGGGRVGAGLAHLFIQQNFAVDCIIEKNKTRFDYLKNHMKWDFVSLDHLYEKMEKSNIILITVQDDYISDVAEQLSRININLKDKVVAHCSGIHSSQSLKPVKMLGALTASLHPIYSFSSDPIENNGLDKVYFDTEGDEEALEVFKIIFKNSANRIIKVNAENKIALHLACVFYSNFYVALVSSSYKIVENVFSINENVSQIFYPLLKATVRHVMEKGIQEGLTGPIKRGDEKTIQIHLKYLFNKYPDLLKVYTQLSQELVSISGLNNNRKKRLINVLNTEIKIC
jgi:predicted short-subunit dehydrogenase-like oxidoreductase (DUF2520 family)